MEFPPAKTLMLLAVLAFYAASRIRELRLSAENERRMRARGGIDAPGGLLPLFVALHVLFPLAMIAEIVIFGARVGAERFLWLALWIVAEILRSHSMRALGDRWSARLIVVPGEPRIRRGLYRYFAHPNYLGVVLELAAIPLLFGAWRTALVVGVANIVLLVARIRAEERALDAAERSV